MFCISGNDESKKFAVELCDLLKRAGWKSAYTNPNPTQYNLPEPVGVYVTCPRDLPLPSPADAAGQITIKAFKETFEERRNATAALANDLYELGFSETENPVVGDYPAGQIISIVVGRIPDAPFNPTTNPTR